MTAFTDPAGMLALSLYAGAFAAFSWPVVVWTWGRS